LALCSGRLRVDATTLQSDKNQWVAIDGLVERYFGRRLGEMTSGQRSTIRSVLEKTALGLQRNPIININPGDDNPAGFVKSNILTEDEKAKLPFNEVARFKYMQGSGITSSLAPPSWNNGKPATFSKEYAWSKGEINISPDWIDETGKFPEKIQHACVTLVHEATHKYANTWDYCYFDFGGGYAKTPEPGLFDATNPKNKFAHHGAMNDMTRHFIGNADSYGYFVYWVGKL
jgi:hypothetical protein